MAIAATHLTTDASGTNASSYATASISPTADCLILAAVASQDSSDTGAPSLSGNGLTWELIDSFIYSTTGQVSRLSLFRAMGAAPSAGAVTITMSSASIGCAWSISEFSGVNTSGANGAGAVLQSATNVATATTSPLTVTLAAFADAANRPYGAFVDTRGDAAELSVGSGFSMLGIDFHTSPQTTIATEWKTSTDTSVDMSPSGAASVDIGGIAVEIVDASFVPPSSGSDIIIVTMG